MLEVRDALDKLFGGVYVTSACPDDAGNDSAEHGYQSRSKDQDHGNRAGVGAVKEGLPARTIILWQSLCSRRCNQRCHQKNTNAERSKKCMAPHFTLRDSP
jgi:hypothetical protein